MTCGPSMYYKSDQKKLLKQREHIKNIASKNIAIL